MPTNITLRLCSTRVRKTGFLLTFPGFIFNFYLLKYFKIKAFVKMVFEQKNAGKTQFQ